MERDAGSYTATASALDSGNYALPKKAAQAFTIGKAVVRIIAVDATGPDNPDVGMLGYTVSDGLVAADRDALDIRLKLGKAGGGDPKTYPIEITYKQNGNYDITTVKGTYTVWKGVKLSVKGYSGEYDGKAHGISVKDDKGNAVKSVLYADSKLNAKQFATSGKSSLT